MSLQRSWLADPVDWEETSRRPGLSREDVAVLLARGTPRRFRTLQNNIGRLPPGYTATVSSSGIRLPARRWNISQAGIHYAGLSLNELAAELRNLLEQSVRRHSKGKRVGLLLSGGYDSTLLATLLVENGVDLRCYCVDAPELFPSECADAFATASRLGVPIRKLVVGLDDLLKAPSAMRPFKTTPNMCLTTAHLLAGSRAAAEDSCDSIMLGTGSDELFGPCTLEFEAVRRFQRKAATVGIAETWNTLSGDRSQERTSLLYRGTIAPFPEQVVQSLFPDLDVRLLLEEDLVDFYRELHAESPDRPYDSMTLQCELELRSADVLLHEFTAAANVHAMPVAFPFYDQSLVELAASTKLEFKVRDSPTSGDPAVIHKYILRHAFRHHRKTTLDTRQRSVATLPFQWKTESSLRQMIMRTLEKSQIWDELAISRKSLVTLVVAANAERDFWSVPRRFWLLYQLTQLEGIREHPFFNEHS